MNCTGIGAGELARDNACFPTKGQTVLVRGQAKSVVTRRHEEDGKEPWEALVIPRPGEEVTMLGGCKIAGDWSTDSDEEITKIILERCKPLVPELLNETGEFDVLAVRVGLRPSRNGRARVEGEQLPNGGFVVSDSGKYSFASFGSFRGLSKVLGGLKHLKTPTSALNLTVLTLRFCRSIITDITAPALRVQ